MTTAPVEGDLVYMPRRVDTADLSKACSPSCRLLLFWFFYSARHEHRVGETQGGASTVSVGDRIAGGVGERSAVGDKQVADPAPTGVATVHFWAGPVRWSRPGKALLVQLVEQWRPGHLGSVVIRLLLSYVV